MKRPIVFFLFLVYIGIFSLGANLKLNEEKKEKETSFIVKATVYHADPKQTDNTPFITASGFKLDPKNPKKHRIIAVSRDLKDSLNFGSKVRLENAGIYNGVYFVQDLMNKRFKKRIDILINRKDKMVSLDSVKLLVLE